MQKKTARIILVLVAGLWIATVWALSVGAVEPDDPQQVFLTHCPVPDPAVCEELGLTHPPSSASPSGSAKPSGTGSASPRPSGSSPSPSQSSASPSPSQSSARPTQGSSPSPSPTQSSSPSPSPSQTTPPPPSIRPSDSQVTAGYARGAFRGRVTAESGRCEPGRRVVVKKVKPGKDATVGRDRTNRRGKWSLSKRNPEGRYYAKVLRKSVSGNNNVTIRCKPDRSRTFRP